MTNIDKCYSQITYVNKSKTLMEHFKCGFNRKSKESARHKFRAQKQNIYRLDNH